MGDILDIDIAAAEAIASFDDITTACTLSGGEGVVTWDVSRIAAAPGPRSAATLGSDDLLATAYALLAAFNDAPDAPKLLEVSMGARELGGTAAEIEPRLKRAMCQYLVEYLWRCNGHGGMKIGQGYVILPSARLSAPNARLSAPTTPPSANAGSAAGSIAGGEARVGATKRVFDELSDVAGELADARSSTGELGQGFGAQAMGGEQHHYDDRPLTDVSDKDKVSHMCV